MIYKTDTHSSPNEIRVLSEIKHPNIIEYLAHFEDSRSYYLVMEKFGTPWRTHHSANELVVIPSDLGEETKYSLLSVTNGSSASLFDYIDEFGSVPSHLLLDIFQQLAQAIGYLHRQGIVHGDIKEENILIGYHHHQYFAKLCDFGHSRKTKRNHQDLKFYGTRDVSAPELFPNLRAAEEDLDSSDCFYGYEEDVWAFGLVLYTMIHGSLPENNDQIVDGIDSLSGHVFYPTYFSDHVEKGNYKNLIVIGCVDLLKRMLTIDPGKRINMEGVLKHPWVCRKRR